MRRSGLSLVLCLLTACAATPPPASSPAATTAQTPVAQPAAERSTNALTPVASVPRTIAEPRIRVGLLSDQSTVTFPRTADGYYLASDQGPSLLRRGFTATAPLANAPVRYAVQVSAISDQSSANTLVEKIRTETGLRVDTVFDVANGQYRILAGDFATSEAATPTRANLTERGYGKDLLVVRRPSEQPFEKRITIVDDEGNQYTLHGAYVTVLPAEAQTITIDKQPYRSAARLHVNARGLINVVNELNFEEYLYGVVPAEMGPSIYDEVEALKAQAVAARTYAFRNLGQFEAEGYDICPGPACQAYKGFAVEHDLSTRAVRETTGLVLTMGGKAVETLYTSTCGGETSHVGTMFPGRNEPHLQRVRCVELDLLSLDGRADSGLLTEQQVDARLFAALTALPETTAWSASEVRAAVEAAMRLAGRTLANQPSVASSRRGDVLQYLAAVLGFDTAGRALTMPEDRRYWFPQTQNVESVPYFVASFLTKYGIVPTQYIDRVSLAQPMPKDELYALLLSWVREHNVLSNAEGKIARLEGRRVSLKQKGETVAHNLPANIPVFRQLGDRYQEYRSVPILVGDRMTVVLSPAKTVVAAIVRANYDGASFDRTSNFANWTRSYRADELVPSINRRQPITQLVDLRPVSVDASQRVIEMEFTAEGGRKFTLKGLPVRWSLNVPDNLFVFDKTRDPDGMDRYTFYGKGWGHGTGMCQVGAYGAAFRGWTFDRILKHYYTGVDVTPIAQATR
ncbi:MAG TPA: SpoIID/LytB domain-containing protein [Thermoanaerobaculia bacterium]|nr:SpoIID/LytB domain-containing protein [Thermoanaerobaculia bacterium]